MNIPTALPSAIALVMAAALQATPAVAQQSAPAAPVAMKLQPGVTAAQLASLPSTQMVEFPHGLKVSVAGVRRMSPLVERLRSARSEGVLRQRPTGPVVAVKQDTPLTELLNAPDASALQLADGRRISAAQFKSVYGHLPRRNAQASRAAATQLAGANAVKVPRGTPLAELLKRPDSDVLESPNGKRIRVGDLRRLVNAGKTPTQR